MTEPFQPDPGDTIEFYNEEAELWETGTVFSYSADRRTYFIQPDDENQPMWGADYTNIRPQSPDEGAGATPSFWEAAKTYARVNRSLSAIVNRQEREIHSLQVRQSSVADERDMWMRQSIANSVNIGKLQAQIDAFPYETGAPVGDKVAARIAEYRERAEKAEGLLSEARVGWKNSDEAANAAEARLQDEKARADLWKARAHRNSLERREEADRAGRVADMLDQTITERDAMTRRANAAEARIEELEDQNRQLKSDLAELKAALRTLAGGEKPAEFPAWVKDTDFEVWNHTGNGRYSLEGSDRFYQDVPLGEVESTYGIRERSDS